MSLTTVLITGGGPWVVLDMCDHDDRKVFIILYHTESAVLISAPRGSRHRTRDCAYFSSSL